MAHQGGEDDPLEILRHIMAAARGVQAHWGPDGEAPASGRAGHGGRREDAATEGDEALARRLQAEEDARGGHHRDGGRPQDAGRTWGDWARGAGGIIAAVATVASAYVAAEAARRASEGHEAVRVHDATRPAAGDARSPQIESDEEYARRLQEEYRLQDEREARGRAPRDHHEQRHPLEHLLGLDVNAGDEMLNAVRAMLLMQGGAGHDGGSGPDASFRARFGGGLDYEALSELSERMGHVPRGLSDDQVRGLPTQRVGNVDELGEQRQCPVCLADFERGEEVQTLPLCCHRFHKECIGPWLRTSRTCPVCRSSTQQ